MKKIINKLKQNKIALKVLKIFKLILDLLVYGFAIFMIIGLAIGQSNIHNDEKAQERHLIPNVVTTPLKNAIQGRYAVYYSIADFMSPLFAEETYKYLTTLSNIGTSGYSNEDFMNGTLITINAQDMLYGTMDSAGDHITTSGSYSVPRFVIMRMTDYTFPAYLISFDFQNGNTIYRYNFYYARYTITNENGEVTFFNWSASNVRENSVNGGETFNPMTLTASNFESYFVIPKNYNFNWIGTGEAKLNEYYNKGYNDGYSLGKEYGESIGEEQGYNEGYYEGLQASEEGETTMFSLITRAFNAIASILDIEILPNLSLGLLMFTPIIVSVIILIIKMVKG